MVEALVLQREGFAALCRAWKGTVGVPVGGDFILVPWTEVLADEVCASAAESTAPFWKLGVGHIRALGGLSGLRPLVYVETEYFGGVGVQVAMYWGKGAAPQNFTGSEAINQALALLGVLSAPPYDRFIGAGLEMFRSTEALYEAGFLQSGSARE